MNPIAAGNRLGDSLSPYLRTHATNPVHWQPWDHEALALAERHNVPILLSIGYSACHWCHVMERESFADEQMAELMNANFVCIKVDREERPDLDKTYQMAHYLLSRRSGGWPLTLFLDPEQMPFFSGTYFPPEQRGGLIGFAEVLKRVKVVWDERRDSVIEQNKSIAQAMASIDQGQSSGHLDSIQVVDDACDRLAAEFDLEEGGIGKAPKFPQTPTLRFATHMAGKNRSQLAPGMEKTLDSMATQGLNDHVGGGFYRYCVDPLWDIPHFEKMLYDNAQLLELLATASVVFEKGEYASLAQQVADWMLGEMRTKEGGFCTALDADSEGEEGKFYLWTKEELEARLEPDELEILAGCTNLAGLPNFERAQYHLHLPHGSIYRPPDEQLSMVYRKLKKIREARVHPDCDDKVLAASCGLGALAFAQAGLLLERPEWLQVAREALSFADQNMVVDGRLRTAWRDGQCSLVPAFLDDYAYLLMARVVLLQDDCSPQERVAAADLAETVIELFDDGGGGLLFTALDTAQTIRRIRSSDDGPAPSGNAVMVRALLLLGWILNRTDLLQAADRILDGFSTVLNEAPLSSPTLMIGQEMRLDPPAVVTVYGERDKAVACRTALLDAMAQGHVVLLAGKDEIQFSEQAAEMNATDDQVYMTVCRDSVCSLPCTDIAAVREQLEAFDASAAGGRD